MFMAAAELAYARIMRCGSATRAASLASSALIMSPRYAGRPSESVGAERGVLGGVGGRPGRLQRRVGDARVAELMPLSHAHERTEGGHRPDARCPRVPKFSTGCS